MAKAIFNTNIETPAPNARPNSYDLDTVITKEGFGDYLIFNYKLGGSYTGVSLLGNILYITDNAYGKISVTVSAGDKFTPIKANAETKLYGFYATRLEFFNNTALEEAIGIIKKDWPSLVGGADRQVKEDIQIFAITGGWLDSSRDVTITSTSREDFALVRDEVTLTLGTTQGGTVSGAGTYDRGSLINFSATPDEGYEFVNWTNSSDRSYFGNANSITNYAILENIDIVANFAAL